MHFIYDDLEIYLTKNQIDDKLYVVKVFFLYIFKRYKKSEHGK